MRVKIENVGKIREADIVISGLTVIAAANNTGKSTIGKTLFAASDAFANFDMQVERDLVGSVGSAIRRKIPVHAMRMGYDSESTESEAFALSRYIVGQLPRPAGETDLMQCLEQVPVHYAEPEEGYVYSSNEGKEGFLQAVIDIAHKLASDDDNSRVCRSDILTLLNVDSASKSALLADRYFSNLFEGQFVSMFTDSGDIAQVALTGADGECVRNIRFEQGRCVSAVPASNETRRVYIIDSPKLPEFFRRNVGALFLERVPQYYLPLLKAVARRRHELELNPASGLGEQVLRERAIKLIVDMMAKSFRGRIDFDDQGMPVLVTDAKVRERIRLSNASMGVKAFSCLRYLIENLIIHEKDVLVLDEPEIHLHPDWQVPYAHALAMIAKRLGVRMLITTHSPYFLKALAAYSHIEGLETDTHYYTADENPLGPVSFREIADGEELAQVYAGMASPLSVIDEDVLRYER